MNDLGAAVSELAAPFEEGYPKEIFPDGKVDEKFLCNFCEKVLRDPVQSYCGHRFCKACTARNISSGQPIQCVRCRHEEVEDDYSLLQPDQIFPDKAVYREMARLKVVCSNKGCSWSGIFKEYEEHAKVCTFRPVLCPDCSRFVTMADFDDHKENRCPERIINCKHCKMEIRHSALEEHNKTCLKYPMKCEACGKKKIPREKMQDHKEKECTNELVKCPVGCGSFERSDFPDHLMSNLPIHMTWTISEMITLHREVGSLTEQIGKKLGEINLRTEENLNTMQVRISALESRHQQAGDLTQLSDIDTKIRQAVEDRQQGITESIKTVEIKAGTFEGIANSLHRELDKTITALENLERHRRAAKEESENLKQLVKALERTVALKDIAIAELDLRVQSLESASYDGTFIWKVADFTKKQQDASQGRSISIYSPAFYTSHHGYKACARLYPNGDGMGKGSHLSLFFVVMRGQYDALQQWPFKQRVTFCLVNQNGGEHILDSFRPDPSSSSFKRPSSDMNIASGCPLFMRLDAVTNPNNGFLRDDTLYIKIAVDVSDLRDPLSNPEDRIKVVPVDSR